MTDSQKLTEIVALILDKGLEDGASHKQWLIDQILRVACGENYDETIECWFDDEWEEGVAP